MAECNPDPRSWNSKVLDIKRISERLFAQEPIRQKICADYDIESDSDAGKMADQLVRSIGQVRSPLDRTEDLEGNRAVFRAAALALASNSREWSGFLGCRGEFETLLKQYDPVAFSRAGEADSDLVRKVADCLGGGTNDADAKAIMEWAKILAGEPGYCNALNDLKSDVGAMVRASEVVPVLAAFLGLPSQRAESRWRPPSGIESWKAPGMQMTLASEFLRNLHWDGFKPDRHIKRLFAQWFPDVIEAMSGRASDLAHEILHRRSKDIICGLKISLTGIAVTPSDCCFTKADNLVWALGAYVEKKRKESGLCYWKTVTAS